MKKSLMTFVTSATLVSTALAGPVDDMLDADREFAALAKAEGVPAAFAAYADDDVRMFPEGGASYQGRGELVKRFSAWPDGATLSWTPMDGVAASSGDFGYTWGTYVFTAKDGDGETSSYGKYVSIWRNDSDGWKFIVDIGNSGPAPDTSSPDNAD